MAEEKQPKPEESVPYPRYCSVLGIYFDEVEEAILDRVWEKNPQTEEESRRMDEFLASIKPGTRGKGLSPEIEAMRKQLEAEGRLGEITEISYLP